MDEENVLDAEIVEKMIPQAPVRRHVTYHCCRHHCQLLLPYGRVQSPPLDIRGIQLLHFASTGSRRTESLAVSTNIFHTTTLCVSWTAVLCGGGCRVGCVTAAD